MPDDGPVSHALRASFAQLAGDKAPASTETLHARLNEFVDAAKALGWPIERIIVAVKRLWVEAGVHASRHVVLTRSPLTETDRILMACVGWCIERYYADRGPASVGKPN
jgi:hypothetical protein